MRLGRITPVWPGRSGAPEQLVKLTVDVDEVALTPRRNKPEGFLKEVCHRAHRSLKVSVPEWGRQRDVQHAEAVLLGGPHLDVTLANGRGQARREQVPGEDPLDRILSADMECHANGIRVAGGVAEAGH